MWIIQQKWLSLCFALLAVSGCAVNRYAGPVGNFRDNASRSAVVLAEFYSTRNQYEIDLYFTEVAVDPSMEVLLKNPTGTPTPLGKAVFAPASIKARLDALDLIGVYANRLADLTASGAPAQFKDAATLLGENLGNLGKTFSALSGAADLTANNYVGPVSNLIGAIGEMILEQKRDQRIASAINKAAPEVDAILILIKNDLDKIFSLQLDAGGNQRFATLVRAYNQADRKVMSYDERKRRLTEIRDAANLRSVDVASAPSALVAAMSDAHHALVRLAKSKRTPSDFSQFNAALELWASRIEHLAGQLRLILNQWRDK
jgi:hypothetical protein